MDRSGQFPFIWNGADYLLLNPLSFHILIKRLFGRRQIQEGLDLSTEDNTCQTIEVTTVDV